MAESRLRMGQKLARSTLKQCLSYYSKAGLNSQIKERMSYNII